MNIKLLNNKTNIFLPTIKEIIENSEKELYISTGFIKENAFTYIFDILKKVLTKTPNIEIKIFAGRIFNIDGKKLKFNPTVSPQTYVNLYQLLELTKKYKGLHIYVSNEDFIHAKCILGKAYNNTYFLCGSSNITKAGLESTGNEEINVAIQKKKNDKDTTLFYLEIEKWFKSLLENEKTIELTINDLEKIKIAKEYKEEIINFNFSSKEEDILKQIIISILINSGCLSSQFFDKLVSDINRIYKNKEDFEFKKDIISTYEESNFDINLTDYYDNLCIKYNRINKKDFYYFIENILYFLLKYFTIINTELEKKENIKNLNNAETKQNKDAILKKPFIPLKIDKYDCFNNSCKDEREIKTLYTLHKNQRLDDSNLFEYQLSAAKESILKYLLGFPGIYIAHETGLGKSAIAAKFALDLIKSNSVKKIILTVPANVIEQWETDTFCDLFNSKDKIFKITDKDCVENIDFENYPIIIVGHEKIREILKTKTFNIDILIIDESHKTKDDKTLLHKELKEKITTKFTMSLSATPLQNKTNDLKNQFSLMHIIKEDEIKYIKDAELKELCDKYLIRKTRKSLNVSSQQRDTKTIECKDKEFDDICKIINNYIIENKSKLKALNYIKQYNQINSNEKIKNISLLENIHWELSLMLTSSSQAYLQTLNKYKNDIISFYSGLLNQNIDNLKINEKKYEIGQIIARNIQIEIKDIEKEKDEDLQFFIDLENFIKKDNKLIETAKEKELINKIGNGSSHIYTTVIFVEYLQTAHYLKEKLQLYYPNKKTEIFCGELKKKRKQEIIDAYQKEEVTFLICTASANVGLNLQKARFLINYDVHWNPQIIEQRIGRVNRVGQKYKIVKIYNFKSQVWVDELKFNKLEKKIEDFNKFFESSAKILDSDTIQEIKNIQNEIDNDLSEDFSNILSGSEEKGISNINIKSIFEEYALEQIFFYILKKYNITWEKVDDPNVAYDYCVKLKNGKKYTCHTNELLEIINNRNIIFEDLNIENFNLDLENRLFKISKTIRRTDLLKYIKELNSQKIINDIEYKNLINYISNSKEIQLDTINTNIKFPQNYTMSIDEFYPYSITFNNMKKFLTEISDYEIFKFLYTVDAFFETPTTIQDLSKENLINTIAKHRTKQELNKITLPNLSLPDYTESHEYKSILTIILEG